MEPNERRVFAGVMAAYERSRLKRAAGGAMLTLLFPLIAFVVGGRLVPSLVLGLGVILGANGGPILHPSVSSGNSG